MSHLTLCIAQHPAVQARFATSAANDPYIDHVIFEQLRVFPLFGVAHRITTEVCTTLSLTLPLLHIVFESRKTELRYA